MWDLLVSWGERECLHGPVLIGLRNVQRAEREIGEGVGPRLAAGPAGMETRAGEKPVERERNKFLFFTNYPVSGMSLSAA